jgi:hypothetical protein
VRLDAKIPQYKKLRAFLLPTYFKRREKNYGDYSNIIIFKGRNEKTALNVAIFNRIFHLCHAVCE